jgi:hypothetical protein
MCSSRYKDSPVSEFQNFVHAGFSAANFGSNTRFSETQRAKVPSRLTVTGFWQMGKSYPAPKPKVICPAERQRLIYLASGRYSLAGRSWGQRSEPVASFTRRSVPGPMPSDVYIV